MLAVPLVAASQASAGFESKLVCDKKIESGGISRYHPDDPDGGGWSMAACKAGKCEKYSLTEPTAAHKTLPFHTMVKLVFENGKSVIVRINDRGPYWKGRILDLNEVAAEKVGLTKKKGVGRGTLYKCRREVDIPLPEKKSPSGP
ncbi:MAG: septal ring lytic transglycosylase RlpA family protein [Alphaproteobacteria bacterium]|nr:septal ring lytic transglycosylase RlpA family protein [Alphaproteobacteria bacterium]